jgi:hypothetical protein
LAFRGRCSSMRRMLTTRTEWAGRLSASLGWLVLFVRHNA